MSGLQMTPRAAVAGSMLVFAAIVGLVVLLPTVEDESAPSEAWRPLSEVERAGEALFKANGCQYCHSQYVRPQDWDYGADRVAQAGDYVGDTPPLLGSERQGPDLSQEGGLRSDDWHTAHFVNPRFTRPDSLMPPFHWLTGRERDRLTAYLQSRGHREADARAARQREWKAAVLAAYQAGELANMEWLHARVPAQWMELPNPYPAIQASIKRGEAVYEHYCIGCHGPVGDGKGPAAPHLEPEPFNFSYLARWKGPVGGMLYHQVMNGVVGTAMPPFKTELESEKIWDVSNYVATHFAGGADTGRGPRGTPASYEPMVPGEPAPPPPDDRGPYRGGGMLRDLGAPEGKE